MSSTEHPKKMAPRSDTPPGLETDGKGHIIPLAERTEGDREKTLDGLRDALHEDGIKNPEHEAEIPGEMPPGQQGQGRQRPLPDDPAGQQGGTRKTGRG
jgi:hypothetical protein